MVLTRILNGCTVEKDPEGCCHIGKDSHGLSCQKDSEGSCVEKYLRGCHFKKHQKSFMVRQILMASV